MQRKSIIKDRHILIIKDINKLNNNTLIVKRKLTNSSIRSKNPVKFKKSNIQFLSIIYCKKS